MERRCGIDRTKHHFHGSARLATEERQSDRGPVPACNESIEGSKVIKISDKLRTIILSSSNT